MNQQLYQSCLRAMMRKATWMGVRHAATGNTFADTNVRLIVGHFDRLHTAIVDRDLSREDIANGMRMLHAGQLLDDLLIYMDGVWRQEPAHDTIVRELIAREIAGAATESLLASQTGELDLDTPSAALERARDCLGGGLASPVLTLDQLDLPSANTERGRVLSLGLSRELDETIGGAGEGELLCILAPPRRGKTTVMRMIGAHMVREGHNVLDLTLETSAAKIGRLYERATVHKTRRDFTDADAAEARRVLASNGGRLWLKDLSHIDVTPDSVEGLIRAQQRDTGERVDAVILDYLELMSPGRLKGDNMLRFAYGRLGKQMRAVGKKFGIPIITAWQVNREGSQRDTITEADISECWDLFKHVDTMIALNRNAGEKANNRMRLGILKQREDDDASDSITVYCDFTTMTMRDQEKNHAIHQASGQGPAAGVGTADTREPGRISIHSQRSDTELSGRGGA